MTDLFVNSDGFASEVSVEKERKNSKVEMLKFLKEIRRKNIETLETYNESALAGNQTAIEKCCESRSQNSLIDRFVETFLKALDAKSKAGLIVSNKDWLFEDCIQTYVSFFIKQNNLDSFTSSKTIRKGMAKYEFVAMRGIIDYLSGLTNANEQRILDGWQMILSDDVWNNFPEYIKKGMSIGKIRMRLNEIISLIKQQSKNGTAATTTVGNTTIINPASKDSSDGNKTKRDKQQDDFVNFSRDLIYKQDILFDS